MNKTKTVCTALLAGVFVSGLVSGCGSVTNPHLNQSAGWSGTGSAQVELTEETDTPESDIDETEPYTPGTAEQTAADPRWAQIDHADWILSQMGVYDRDRLPSGRINFYPNTMYPTDGDLGDMMVHTFRAGRSIDEFKTKVDHSGVDTTVHPIEQWSSADLYPSILYHPDATWIDAYTVWTTAQAMDYQPRWYSAADNPKPTEFGPHTVVTTVRLADGTVHWVGFEFLYNYDHWMITNVDVHPEEYPAG